MAIFTDVQNALNKKLATLSISPSVKIEWENTKIDPVQSESYIHPTLFFSKSILRDFSGVQEDPGFLQIDIFVPLHKGTKRLSDIVDAIYTLFKGTGVLTEGSSKIYLREVSRGQSGRDGSWYVGIIEIYFTCYD